MNRERISELTVATPQEHQDLKSVHHLVTPKITEGPGGSLWALSLWSEPPHAPIVKGPKGLNLRSETIGLSLAV